MLKLGLAILSVGLAPIVWIMFYVVKGFVIGWKQSNLGQHNKY